jgi:hypothetical protein
MRFREGGVKIVIKGATMMDPASRFGPLWFDSLISCGTGAKALALKTGYR